MEQPTEVALILQETGHAFPLDQDVVTVGRKSGNTIMLENDLKISRHHCAIFPEAGRFIIRDMGSSNGTYLNDERLTAPRPLSNEDIIRVGSTTIVVHLPAADTEPSLKPPPVAGRGETLMRVPSPVSDPTVLRGSLPKDDDNPYVGPRTFTQRESDRFFGREREARELLSLVISERLVIFYAQSGAGKSSLINTRLVPQLREAGLPVLPIGRVSGELPEGIHDVENIYLFNLLLSLDESDGDPNRFTQMSLTDFLLRLTSIDEEHYYFDDTVDPADEIDDEDYQPSPYVLIIDQFEEIVTTHPAHWQDREGFFKQLDQAMTDDPMLWVILSLREDYVATLNPYAHLVQDNMRARFYMQRMSYQAGLEAVVRPAQKYNRPFAPGVAENLVDNLRQIRIYGSQSSGQAETQVGQYIEPVQLQVVCYQLWQNLEGRPTGEITQQNLEEMGDVDQALAQFYKQALAEVVYQTDASEIELRNWFETKLITETGTRGTVYRGAKQTGGIDNRVVDLLVDKFILRSETRSGGTWYELVHDRFVEPIYLANQAWRLKQPLIQMAQTWEESGRPSGLLLEGQPLTEALDTGWQALGPLVKEFLTTSREAQKDKEQREQGQKLKQAQAFNTRLSRRNRAITIISIVAVILALAAGVLGAQWFLAFRDALLSQTKVDTAERVAATAEQAAATAEQAAATAEQAVATAEQAAEDNAMVAATSDKHAVNAQGTAEAESTLAAAQKTVAAANAATADALSTAAAANAAQAQDILTQQNTFLTAVAQATAAKAIEVDAAAATAESAQATLTTEAAAPPTSSDSDTSVAGQPTNPPTPTPTATPDIAATQTVISYVYATQTVEAQGSTCLFEPAGDFIKIWTLYQDRLGCPQQQSIRGSYAEQPFENGYMIWSNISDLFFVMVGEEKGVWDKLDKKEVDSYQPNPDGVACEPETPPPDGLLQPVRGFGAIWCGRDDIRKQIGWATAPEFAVADNLLQPYENGFILWDSRNFTHVLFSDDGTYIRE